MHLGDVVNKVAECDLLDWFGRAKLINCICDFVLLSPQIGEVIYFSITNLATVKLWSICRTKMNTANIDLCMCGQQK